jgi:putative transposase
MANEESLREQAIALQSQGVKMAEIARLIGRSRQWVYKWVERHHAGGEEWNKSQSRAPHSVSVKTADIVEKMVVESRLRLDAAPHMESGAYAIWYDLKDRGIDPPSVSTINRIISARGLTKKKPAYKKSGIDYPEIPVNTQLMDLIGPRFLNGGARFYLLTIISNDTRHAGVYPLLNKSADEITRGVVAFWKHYSVPDFLQLDNELSFKGSNRHPRGLGTLIRTALLLNVTPRFIPVAEPWRNGTVERFNQKIERTLLLQEHRNYDDLVRHAAEFMDTHNTAHHYSTLEQKTPEQLDHDCGLPIKPLSKDYKVSGRPELDNWNCNEIHFIRLVRSDLTIDVLNSYVVVSSSLMHSYVEAVLAINNHRLLIRQDGRTIQSMEFVMPVV